MNPDSTYHSSDSITLTGEAVVTVRWVSTYHGPIIWHVHPIDCCGRAQSVRTPRLYRAATPPSSGAPSA